MSTETQARRSPSRTARIAIDNSLCFRALAFGVADACVAYHLYVAKLALEQDTTTRTEYAIRDQSMLLGTRF